MNLQETALKPRYQRADGPQGQEERLHETEKEFGRSSILFSWFLGNLAIHLVTPTLPSLTRVFHTHTGNMQLAISCFLLGKAVSVLFWGPYSEKKGRKSIFLAGLLLFSLSNFAAAASHSIHALLMWRFIQGCAVGATLLMGRAIINDRHQERQATRLFSFYFSLAGVIICFLPLLGATVYAHFSWQMPFLLMGAYGLLLFFFNDIPASKTPAHHEQSSVQIFPTILKHPLFMGYLLISALMMAGESAFNTSAAFILIKNEGISLKVYGSIKTAMLIAHVAGTAFCGLLVHKVEGRRLVGIGVYCFMLASFSMLAFHFYKSSLYWAFIYPMLMYYFGTGFIVACTAASIVRPFPKHMATAMGISLFVQFSLSALFSAISAFAAIETIKPFVLLLSLISFLAYLSLKILLIPHKKRLPQSAQ